VIDYTDHLQTLKTHTITSALQLLAEADRVDRQGCVETCNRVLETLAGRTSTSLHKHVSSQSVNKPQPARLAQ